MNIRKTLRSRKKSTSAFNVECLDAREEEDDNGFIDGDVDLGSSVATFSFAKSIEQVNPGMPSQESPAAVFTFAKPSVEEQYNIVPLRGVTPPINGENFTLKRGYQLRPSTLRKLNELKAKHPDVNVYLNTILDAAINHYYDYIFNKNGQF